MYVLLQIQQPVLWVIHVPSYQERIGLKQGTNNRAPRKNKICPR